MRAVVIALGCLAASFGLSCLAGGQDRIADHATSERLFWRQLYGAGGTSLYCGKAFDSQGGLFTASPVYSSKQLKRSLRCITERQCSIMNPRYPYIAADLHNLYPALTRVELARRNAQFGELDDSVPSQFDDIGCSLQASFQLVEPRDAVKGDIARAIFYMHAEYDLPVIGPVRMFQAWNRMDPPDAEEQARNDKIADLQGTRNRFIDDPSLADRLTGN